MVEKGREPSGLLFIGDPHLSSVKPSRRVDDYTSTVMNKMLWCVLKANELNAVPVILGDTFDRPSDTHPRLLSGFFSVLLSSIHKPIILAGNHDLKYGSIYEGTCLEITEKTGLANIVYERKRIETPAGSIYAVPYDHDIPDELDGEAVMITHHELAFGSYESVKRGNIPLKEIRNCPLVVNGHLHSFHERCFAGGTAYFNAGSIVRLTIRDRELTPSVWLWRKESPQTLSQYIVPHEPIDAVMDMSDSMVENYGVGGSSFTEALLQVETKATEDGSYLREELARLLSDSKSRDVLSRVFAEIMSEL